MGKLQVSETVFVKDIKKTRPIDVIVMNSHGVGQVCRVHRLPRRGETMEAWGWHVEEDGGKGATVSVEAYEALSELTIDGQNHSITVGPRARVSS